MNQKSKRILPCQHVTSRGHPTSFPLISVTSHLWDRLNKTMKHYTWREYVWEKWQSLKGYPAYLPLAGSTPYWAPRMWNMKFRSSRVDQGAGKVLLLHWLCNSDLLWVPEVHALVATLLPRSLGQTPTSLPCPIPDSHKRLVNPQAFFTI